MTLRRLHCYAYGHGSDWEAICTDLDIAVQGESLVDVKKVLGAAIDSYIEAVKSEATETQTQLFRRKSPWYVRLKLYAEWQFHRLVQNNKNHNGDTPTNFIIPCHV